MLLFRHKKKIIVFLLFWFSLPNQLFNDPVCTVLEDKYGNLLGAHIAKDGQWRFPTCDTVPFKFATALIEFEDARFYYHPGIDIFSLFRAVYQDIVSWEIVSGGSTITMQLMRLSRKQKSRSVWQKFMEIVTSLRLELTTDKKEILQLYATHAPFGGNVVGLEAASWRYFGRKPSELSWAEAAMLAVLPNNPALVHPGRNRKLLEAKRNRLLQKLMQHGYIDKNAYELAIQEQLPDKPKAFNQIATHLLFRIEREKRDKITKAKYESTIDFQLQQRVNEMVAHHCQILKSSDIQNAAVLVVSVPNSEVLAYVGNVKAENKATSELINADVDMIVAERSSGSILKPFLFAAMLTDGIILPNTLIYDIPIHIDGYSPRNFNLGFEGAVPARRALARSLNVPSIFMLRKYGNSHFYNTLHNCGITSLHFSAEHYGLSLVLGGAEVKLWDLAGVYSSMSRVLTNANKMKGKYAATDWTKPTYSPIDSSQIHSSYQYEPNVFSASAIWTTFNAMIEAERPDMDSYWQNFSSTHKIAWKTGTSFGFRDAWAIGVTPEYCVAVWVGNADGEGRPGLVGVRAAAPLMFEVFGALKKKNSWFSAPNWDMEKVNICKQSGALASEICPDTVKSWIPISGKRSNQCSYHKLIPMDKTQKYRVTSDCENPDNIIMQPWFVLPTGVEWFYKHNNPTYRPLPLFRKDCIENQNIMQPIEVLYPKNNTIIYLPTNLDGTISKTVFEAAHRQNNISIFWYVDNNYIGTTFATHKITVNTTEGKHLLTIIDEDGNDFRIGFEIKKKTN